MRSIAGAALICSAAMALTPKTKVKSALRLICGLLLICAMLSPLVRNGAPELSMNISQYRAQAAALSAGAQENSNELSRTIIEDELEAYILDKAREMGETPGEIKLELRWSSEGFWYPQSAEINGAGLSVTGRNRLENLIEAELGISPERQYWSENEN